MLLECVLSRGWIQPKAACGRIKHMFLVSFGLYDDWFGPSFIVEIEENPSLMVNTPKGSKNYGVHDRPLLNENRYNKYNSIEFHT